MSNEKLQKMKSDKLKFCKVQWTQITPTYIKPAIRYKSAISQLNPSSNQAGKLPYFAHSKILFTEKEQLILKRAESNNKSNDEKLKLNSRFQKIEQNQGIQKVDLINTKKILLDNDMLNEKNIFETCDSIISIKSLNDDEGEINNIDEDSKKERKDLSYNAQITSVSSKDIKEQVWTYTHSINKENDSHFLPKYFGDSIVKENERLTINKTVDKGHKKILSAVNKSSNANNESDEIKNLLKSKNKTLKQNLENSYSALKYSMYLHHHCLEIPDYIDELNFSINDIGNKRKLKSS